jgi:hypothetical protein
MKRNTAIVLGGSAVAAGLGYVFWLQPYLAKKRLEEELLRRAKEEQAKKGGSLEDQLKAVGKVACKGAAAYYKVPPDVSGPLCSAVVAAGAFAVKKGGKYVVKGAVAAGKGVGKAGKAVGKGVVKGEKAVVGGVKGVAHKLHLFGLDDWLHS